jgi:hypothetical protein
MKFALICLSIFGIIFSLSVYSFRMTSKPVNNPIVIDGGKYSSSKVTLTVSPTSSTVANTDYHFNVTIGTLPLVFHTSWNTAQLAINYSQTTSTHIANYEATYLSSGQRPIALVSTYQIVHTHNVLWILLSAFLVILIALIVYSIYKERKQEEQQKISDRLIAKRKAEAYQQEQDLIQQKLRDEEDKREHELELIAAEDAKKNSSIIQHAIMNALVSMDSTFKWYDNEDNANRELISTLHALGFGDAVYHQLLNNGRTTDGFVSNSIIEGKLDLSHSDSIDRLLGQIDDYLVSSYDIHVVLYGIADSNALNRIRNKIKSNPDRVFLSYLTHPQRTRRDTEVMEAAK